MVIRKMVCVALMLLFASCGEGHAKSLLVRQGHSVSAKGLGYPSWSCMQWLIDREFSNVDIVASFDDAVVVHGYDALWIDMNVDQKTFGPGELSVIMGFSMTGKRIVFIGDDPATSQKWNREFISDIIGVRSSGVAFESVSHVTASAIGGDELTEAVTTVFIPSGAAVNRGQPLLSSSVLNLFGSETNILALLDADVLSDAHWMSADNGRLAQNIAAWIGASPVIRCRDWTVEDDWSEGTYAVNGDQHINPGERVRLAFELVNKGSVDFTDLTMMLSANNDPFVTIIKGTSHMDVLRMGRPTVLDEAFIVEMASETPDRHRVAFELVISDLFGETRTVSCPVTIFVDPLFEPEKVLKISSDGFGETFSSFERVSATDDGHVYVVWAKSPGYFGPDFDVFFNVSHDFGQTWKDQDILIHQGAEALDEFFLTPMHQIASDMQGHVYIVWLDVLGDGVFFARSTDFGETWTVRDAPVAPAGLSSGELQLVGTEAGDVYVLTSDYDFNVSHDFGVTWEESRSISPLSFGFFLAKMTADEQGHVYVLTDSFGFEDTPGSEDAEELIVLVSHDYGLSWQQRSIGAGSDLSLTAVQGADIGCDAQGHVYVTWMTEESPVVVKFNQSQDFGLTWQSEPTVISSTDARIGGFVINMSHDRLGNIVVVWEDLRHQDIPKIYANASHDFGQTWQDGDIALAPDLDSIFAGFFPEVQCDDDGTFYVLWRAESDCDDDRKFLMNYSEDGGRTWLDTLWPIRANPGPEGLLLIDTPAFTVRGTHTYIVGHDFSLVDSDSYVLPLVRLSEAPQIHLDSHAYHVAEGETVSFVFDVQKAAMPSVFIDTQALTSQARDRLATATVFLTSDASDTALGQFQWQTRLGDRGIYDAVMLVAQNANGQAAFIPIVIEVASSGIHDVSLRGQSWSDTFLQGLSDQNLGVLGYDLLAHQAESILPWTNIDQVVITFADGAIVRQEDLLVTGINVPTYSIVDFRVDTSNRKAVWTLDQTVFVDKLRLTVQGHPFDVRILSADGDRSGRTNIIDALGIRARLFRAAGDAMYDVFYDFTGNGRVDILDALSLRRALFRELPE